MSQGSRRGPFFWGWGEVKLFPQAYDVQDYLLNELYCRWALSWIKIIPTLTVSLGFSLTAQFGLGLGLTKCLKTYCVTLTQILISKQHPLLIPNNANYCSGSNIFWLIWVIFNASITWFATSTLSCNMSIPCFIIKENWLKSLTNVPLKKSKR